MGGHVLWTDGDVIRILKNLIQIVSGKASYQECVEVLQPLLNQAAYKEQVYIVQKMIDSGMSKEECAFRLGCTKERIVEILEFYNSSMEYDYSYMKFKELFSKGE